MRKLFIMILLCLPLGMFSQTTPKGSYAIVHTADLFVTGISVGSTLYDVSTQKRYVCITSALGTESLITASAKFKEEGPSIKDSTLAGYRLSLSGKTLNNTSYWKNQDTLNVSDGLVKVTSKKLTAITDNSSNWDAGYTYRLISATGTAPLALTLGSNALTGSVAAFSTSTTAPGVVTGSNSLGATYFLNGNNAWSIPINTTYSAGYGMGLSGTTFNNLRYQKAIDTVRTLSLIHI